MMSVITHKQRKLLRYAISSLGLQAHYRDILLVPAGVSSSTELTLPKLQAVMEYLKSQGFEYKQRTEGRGQTTAYRIYLEKWKERVGERAGMATPEQLALIDCLWDQLAWWWNKNGSGKRDAALKGFIRKQCGVSFLEFVKFKKEEEDRYSGAHELIEALKKIGSRNG